MRYFFIIYFSIEFWLYISVGSVIVWEWHDRISNKYVLMFFYLFLIFPIKLLTIIFFGIKKAFYFIGRDLSRFGVDKTNMGFFTRDKIINESNLSYNFEDNYDIKNEFYEQTLKNMSHVLSITKDKHKQAKENIDKINKILYNK